MICPASATNLLRIIVAYSKQLIIMKMWLRPKILFTVFFCKKRVNNGLVLGTNLHVHNTSGDQHLAKNNFSLSKK